MNRTKQLRTFYFELRELMGPKFSTYELIKLAAALVEFTNKDFEENYRVPEPRSTFDEQEVDIAIADGGWRILNREPSYRINDEDEGQLQYLRTKEKLKRYLLGL